MEDHSIGKHWQNIIKINFNHSDFPNCALKDYLNFYCNTCNKNLCKEHYHHPVSCPFAKEEGCVKQSVIMTIKAPELRCSYSACGHEIINSKGYHCKFCNLIFCLKHRIECDHQCANKKVSLKDKYLDNKNNFKEKLMEVKNKK